MKNKNTNKDIHPNKLSINKDVYQLKGNNFQFCQILIYIPIFSFKHILNLFYIKQKRFEGLMKVFRMLCLLLLFVVGYVVGYILAGYVTITHSQQVGWI